jgi:hypothetical protein
VPGTEGVSELMAEEKIPLKSESGNGKHNGKHNGTVIPIGDEVTAFVKQIDSLCTSLSLAIKVTTTVQEKISEALTKFFDKHATLLAETENQASYSIERQHSSEYENLKRQRENADLTLSILPRSFIVSLVTQLDAFLARLIRALYYTKPELLIGAENNLSFAQLLELNSIDSAKEYILEREVERVLRKSYAEQLAWLENTFDVQLKKEFAVIWPVFIEVTERKNHFIHRNGIISNHYITVCKENGLPVDRMIKVGDTLPVSPDYFDAAYRCIYEMGVKLTHILWRKFKPADLEQADSNLIALSHDLIVMGRYDLAISLLDFAALTLDKYFNEETRRTFILNRAQAYKWNKQENICSLILTKDDWTGSSDKHQLAVAVLSDNFQLAVRLMEKIGPDKAQDVCYKEWPLFRELRKTFDFHRVYEKIYHKGFQRVEQVRKPVQKTEKVGA